MARGQTTIEIPEALAAELDRLAGKNRRSAYAAEVLWRDVRRNKQRKALAMTQGAWLAKDHPELAQGGAAFVEELRSERDERFESTLHRQEL